MICNKRKLLYLHPPRNGGKSIEDVFFDKRPHKMSSCHKQISLFIEGGIDINSYYKFMFCRNPWDRAVSLYCWWCDPARIHQHEGGHTKEDFANWVSVQLPLKHMHRTPQTQWITYRKPGNRGSEIIKLDFLGRFENYKKDFNKLCKNLNIDLKLPHHNALEHKHYSEYYDDKSRELVAKIFRKDVEYFEYEFGG